MRNIQCKNCGQLHYGWCEPKLDSPDTELFRDCQYFRQKTNMDILQHSSTSDLAEFLCSDDLNGLFCMICSGFDGDYCDGQCKKHCEQWLMKEVDS